MKKSSSWATVGSDTGGTTPRGCVFLVEKVQRVGAWASDELGSGLHSPISISFGGVQFALWPKFGLVFGLVLAYGLEWIFFWGGGGRGILGYKPLLELV